jgi:hypothetical protein
LFRARRRRAMRLPPTSSRARASSCPPAAAVGHRAVGRCAVICFPFCCPVECFRGVPSLVSQVATRLVEVAPRSEVRLLNVEPAAGAVTLARAAAQGRRAVPSYI